MDNQSGANSKYDKVSIQKQIFTIPNILSFVRLALIPLIVWLYCVKKSPEWTALIIIISGITDIVDGFIARKFNMISDFGKVLDPIADKLTQATILFCLVMKFPLMLAPLILMFVKELTSFILGVMILKKTEQVHGAVWHGKLNTVLLDVIIIIHIIWYKIAKPISALFIIICTIMMFISFVLYTISNIRYLKNKKTAKGDIS